MIGPLHTEYNKIRGPMEMYVVPGRQYNKGDVLDHVPADAVKFVSTLR